MTFTDKEGIRGEVGDKRESDLRMGDKRGG